MDNIIEVIFRIYNMLVYNVIEDNMAGAYVELLGSLFMGMITTLTIITAVISFIKPRREKYIEKQLIKFDDYAGAVTGKEMNRQVYDRYSALRNIYLKYNEALNDVKRFDKLLGLLEFVFIISGIIAWIAVVLSLIAIKIYWPVGSVIIILVTCFVICLVKFLIGFAKSCRLDCYYPEPEDLLNPLKKLESNVILKLRIDEDFVQNMFFYGLAIRVNTVDNLNKLKLQGSDKECTHYLSIYCFLPYKINELTVDCEFDSGKHHAEKIYNFADEAKNEKGIVNCILHNIEKIDKPVKIEVCIQKDNETRIIHEYRQHNDSNDGCYYPTGITITTRTCFESELTLDFAKSERVIW